MAIVSIFVDNVIAGQNSLKIWSSGSVPMDLTKIRIFHSDEAETLKGVQARLPGTLESITVPAGEATAYSMAYAKLIETMTKAYADGIVTEEEARAIAEAQAVADTAQAYTELKEVTTKAYADGIVTAEETRAIADAQAKLDAAKAWSSVSDNVIPNPDFELGMNGWVKYDAETPLADEAAFQVVQDSNAVHGAKVLRVTGSGYFENAKYIPINVAKKYVGEAIFRPVVIGSDGSNRVYFGVRCYDENKTVITNSYTIASNLEYTSPEADPITVQKVTFGDGGSNSEFEPGTKYIRLVALINYQGSADAVTDIHFLKFTEAASADLAHSDDPRTLDGNKVNTGSQITIGNIVDGDFCRMTAGDLIFYYWNGSAHTQYKSLKRREEGVSQNGVTVTIPGYFKTTPLVDIVPKSIQTFSTALAAYNVDQILQCEAQNITEYIAGRYRFTVKALLIASGAGTDSDAPSDVSGTDTRMLYWNNLTVIETLISSSESSPATTTVISVSGSAQLIAPRFIHGLRMTTTLVITSGDTGTHTLASKSWTDVYNIDAKTLSVSWANVAIPVSSGTHTCYLKTVFEAAAWENLMTCETIMENMNISYTFAPDGQEAAGDIKWIATGE